MKKINFSMLFLAMLVISMFLAAGISISYHFGYVLLFIVLGFLTMGLGLTIKRKRSGSQ